ncbi:HAMP domain-containing sensor histidine kinase [Cumulibacter manganitolerans]|uniref:HAMP domain-containing sensor histidine kinase n=1 Tax=Cumulibacter manganitolerans TaxID=1884992 RepID=UPI001E5D6FCF|nr:ATP-binding protein [Cumulibacter manganitolerans]
MTWYVTQRITKPLHALSDAAHAVAQGEHHVRVADTGQGAEIDTLGQSFNHMALQLETTETTRRRLLTDIAHELRTPLATLAARLEGLEDGVTEWDPHALRVFRSQVDRLTRLASDLSEVSRAEEHRLTVHLEVIDLSTVVRATADDVRGAFKDKNVALDVHTPEHTHEPRVIGDPERLGQLLENLLSNALRHTPPTGSVTLNVTSSNEQVTTTVHDTGEGIPTDHLEHVFERFYRGDSARHADGRGSGVGLTIARGIAESHGGRLRALDSGEGGATFVLELPRWGGEPAQR